MGRLKNNNINEVNLLKMRREGKTLKEISKAMGGVSIPTLTRRLAKLHHEKGILTKYRQLQGLQLTELQARILETIDFDHIEKASLINCVKAFDVLTKAEKSIQGKESVKVWGLMAHLLALENDE